MEKEALFRNSEQKMTPGIPGVERMILKCP
jgi:hypothetical protein